MVTLRCCEIIVKHQQMNESSVGASFVPCLVALEEAREKKYGYNKSTFGFGVAHEYANPELIEQKKGAFERAMLKKHALDRYEEV